MKAKVINNEVIGNEIETVEVPEEAITEIAEEKEEAKKPGIVKRTASAVFNGVKDGANYLWTHKKAVAVGGLLTVAGAVLAAGLSNNEDSPIEGEFSEVTDCPVDEPASENVNEE